MRRKLKWKLHKQGNSVNRIGLAQNKISCESSEHGNVSLGCLKGEKLGQWNSNIF
jgi:hypothetical protein